jgi:hypothetical protein
MVVEECESDNLPSDTDSPGGEGGYRNPSREFMRMGDFGQFGGAAFKKSMLYGPIPGPSASF